MGRKAKWPPTLYLHTTGQGYVKFKGQSYYLGRHGTEDCKRRYLELVTAIEANNGGPPPNRNRAAMTVAEMVARFLQEAFRTRRKPDGSLTSECRSLAYAMRPIVHLYGSLPLKEIAPSHLKEVRQLMIDGYKHPTRGPQRAQSRTTINRNMSRIKLAFRWAAEEGLIEAELFMRLRLIRGIRYGESRAKESGQVPPAPEADLAAAISELPRIPRAMVELQLLCGCRPGEIVKLCPGDLNCSGAVWTWTLKDHKNAWRGHDRTIYFGPKAQAILRPFLNRVPALPCFSPREASIEIRPGTTFRTDGNAPKDHYAVNSYEQAIERACKRAKVPIWSPGQLRHNAASRMVSEFGWDVARILLGHKHIQTTRIYAVDDVKKATEAVLKIG